MQVIDTFVHSVQLIAGAIFVVLAAAGVAGLYFFRFHRRKVKEKHIDYSNFKRMDSLEYARFDDVAENMVVTDGGRRFVGGISCGGCDYRDAESGERLQVIRGYLSFLNVLDNQYIQFWQMARDVNLDRMVSDYKKQLSRLQEQRYLLSLDYEELRKESEKIPETALEEYDRYYGRLRRMQQEMTSMGYRCRQLEVQVQYLESVSGEKADPHLDQLYLFDWTYNALDFTQELTEAEVYDRAEKQIQNKASAYIAALKNCGIKARLLTGVEILEQMRRYTHPESAAKFRVEDILQSAYDSIAVTSDSLRHMEQEADKSLLEQMAAEFEQSEQEGNAG